MFRLLCASVCVLVAIVPVILAAQETSDNPSLELLIEESLVRERQEPADETLVEKLRRETVEAVADALRRAGLGIYAIKIDCNGPITTLTGQVPTRKLRDKVGQVAEQAPGVWAFRNRVTFNEGSPEELADQRAEVELTYREIVSRIARKVRSAELRGRNVVVEYREGTVTLTGEVGSQQLIDSTCETLGYLPDVTAISNRLVIKPDLASPARTLPARIMPQDEYPLSYWIQQLTSDDPAIHAKAVQAVTAHSDWEFVYRPRGMPLSLGVGEDTVSQDLERVSSEIKRCLPHVLVLLNHKVSGTRSLAVQMLPCMRTAAAVARPRLLQMLYCDDPSNSPIFEALTALLYVSPSDVPAIPDLPRLLPRFTGHSAASEILRPADDLPAVKPDDQATQTSKNELEMPQFSKDDVEAFSAGFAAVIMVSVLADSNRTTTEVPTLAEIARSKSAPRVLRLMVLETLATLETDARCAAPALRELLRDEDHFLRFGAAATLISISEDRKRTASEVFGSLILNEEQRQKFEPRWKEWSEELARLESPEIPSSDDALEDPFKNQMIAYIRDEGHGFAQRQTIRFLAHDGPRAKYAVPALQAALLSPHPYTREAALKALQSIDPTAVSRQISPTNDCQASCVQSRAQRRYQRRLCKCARR